MVIERENKKRSGEGRDGGHSYKTFREDHREVWNGLTGRATNAGTGHEARLAAILRTYGQERQTGDSIGNWHG